MPKYQVIIEPKANDHLEELFEFYEGQRIGKGTDFLASFSELLDSLEKSPSQWQFLYTKDAGIRRAIIHNPQVIILYKIVNQTVYVSDIFDSRSDWRKV